MRKIQNALLSVDRPPGVQIRDAERAAPFTYGEDTTNAVRNFKNSFNPKILGPGQTFVDPIVGRQTIRRLDLLLQQQAKDDDIVVEKTTDVLLRIIGHDNPAQSGTQAANSFNQLTIGVRSVDGLSKTIQTDEYLQLHNPLKHFMFFGGAGADSMARLVKDNADPKGAVTIIGMSIGGPTALEVGRSLGKSFKINYMGICDAAFSNAQDAPEYLCRFRGGKAKFLPATGRQYRSKPGVPRSGQWL